MIKIISNFINNYYSILISILWLIIRYIILCNFKDGELIMLMTARYKTPIIDEEKKNKIEMLIKNYYVFHVIQFGLEAAIIMIMLKPTTIIITRTSGGGSL